MSQNDSPSDQIYDPIKDPVLAAALNALGRSVNFLTTYGKEHPAVLTAVTETGNALNKLFIQTDKVLIGAMHGALIINGNPVRAEGSMQVFLKRRLAQLGITALRLARGISTREIEQLGELLSSKETATFQQGLKNSGLQHIQTENTTYQAVREGEGVYHHSMVSGGGGGGTLVLDVDDEAENEAVSASAPTIQVNEIVAFLNGDSEATGEVNDELKEMAADPAKLGQMIMESVSIRQKTSNLADGESLNDIVLGCLRRTYTGLRKQPAFQSAQGSADLRKSLLLLEENLLDRMRDLVGEEDEELDRQIVQAVRQMDQRLGFEVSAKQYFNHKKATANCEEEIRKFIQAEGPELARELLAETGIPPSEWRRILIESQTRNADLDGNTIANGLNTLASAFSQLERLMQSDKSDDGRVKHLIEQANDNLSHAIGSTKGKLDHLSQQLGTTGGHGLFMDHNELLTSIAEIAQELMQPLTAIKVSLEMITTGFVKYDADEQNHLLELASNSAEHLRYLMSELIEIVGCPVNKGVDERFHTTSEEVILLQSQKL